MATAVRDDRRQVARPRKELSRKELRTYAGRFAAHLAALLEERGWSTLHAATNFGVGEPAVRKWLRAESVPDAETLERIGKALNTCLLYTSDAADE